MNIKPIHCLTTLTCVLLPRVGLALPQAPSTPAAAKPVEATAHASVADPGALAPLLFWADWSADGFMDAWVVQPDGSGLLLENNGLGGFHDRTREAGLSEVKGARMAAWADVDGDRRLDLYLPAWRGASRLFLQQDGRLFQEVTRGTGLPADARPIHAEWIDYDKDGAPDLYLVTQMEDLLYHNLGKGQFERVELGVTPRDRSTLGAAWSPATIDEARAALGLPGSSTVVQGAGSGVNPTPGGNSSPAAGALICAGSIEDMATGFCLSASSVPTLGMLYPISNEWYVDAATGNVGIGTTAPASRLTVNGDVDGERLISRTPTGTAPFEVQSSTKVDSLNVDQLDGLDSADFRQQASLITSADIQNESITAFDLAARSVGASEIAFGVIDSSMVLNESITASDLAPDSVGASEIAANSVYSAEIVDGSISGADIGSNGAASGQVLKWNGGSWVPSVDLTGFSPWSASGQNIHFNGGRVGIATSTPSAALDVRGDVAVDTLNAYRFRAGVNNSDHGLAWHGPGKPFGGASPDGPALFGYDGGLLGSKQGATERAALRWDSQGRVGIGTVTPQDQLHVLGSMRTVAPNSGAKFFTPDWTALGYPQVVAVMDGGNGQGARLRFEGAGNGSAGHVDIGQDENGDFRVSSDMYVFGQGSVGPNGQHVALFENLNGGNEDGIAIKINVHETHMSSANNFMTFYAGTNTVVGRIEGTSSGGVTYGSQGADYAEWLERADASEKLSAGMIVGVRGGKISKLTEGAEQILAISSKPIVLGNTPAAGQEERYEKVGFMGQVPTWVLGEVEVGDYIVASGDADGMGRALAADEITARDLPRILGRAWSASTGVRVSLINVAVGLDRSDVASVVQQQLADHDRLALRVAELETRLESVDALAERLATFEAQASQR